MKRFKNILYVADRPSTASPTLERALELAQANRAQLTVLDVIEPAVWSADNQARFGTDLTTILRDRRLEELHELTAAHAGRGVALPVRVEVGTPFLEVIRAVLRDGFDLVIKCAEQPHGFFQRPFGANDQHLIRKCPCPVWIDRPERARPYRKILAAVDPVGDAGAQLDRLVLDLATSFVAWEGSEVHVAHAWWLPGENQLRTAGVQLPPGRVAELLQGQRETHARALQALLADYGMTLDAPQVHFAKGSPAALIAEVAAGLPADLIVLGSVGRTGVPGFFIGNTAESVIQSTTAPVLTVKPAGFRSPVVA